MLERSRLKQVEKKIGKREKHLKEKLKTREAAYAALMSFALRSKKPGSVELAEGFILGEMDRHNITYITMTDPQLVELQKKRGALNDAFYEKRRKRMGYRGAVSRFATKFSRKS